MAIKKLANGVRFDTVKRILIDEPLGSDSSTQPVTDFISTIQYQRVSTPRTSTSRPSTQRRSYDSVWRKINNFVGGIGNWLGNHIITFSAIMTIAFIILTGIVFVKGLIFLYNSFDLWVVLLIVILGLALRHYLYSLAKIGCILLLLIACIPLLILRYVFYNLYTLLIFTTLVVAFFIYAQVTPTSVDKDTSVATPVTLQPNYFCNVNTILNVREFPRKNAQIVGHLERGDKVYVYSIDENNFAKINFKGTIAYASANYLRAIASAKASSRNIQSTHKNKTIKKTQEVVPSKISTSIKQAWIEHNVFQNKQKGMKIHIEFYTYNMQHIMGNCVVRFCYTSGVELKDYNNLYHDKQGNVAIMSPFKSGYENAVYKDFVLFMPYGELHLPDEGKIKLKAKVELWTNQASIPSKKLATSDWLYFWYGS
ncbi:MAG: SH3 domain-containing protein [Bacteroidales bacterium]|nr:SH3 domain-containing protein [Bacteroidales bacterium]